MQEETKCCYCGYATNRHLVHTITGKCYCVAHYLVHYLSSDLDTTRKEANPHKNPLY